MDLNNGYCNYFQMGIDIDRVAYPVFLLTMLLFFIVHTALMLVPNNLCMPVN
jgi:hypothetical protein